MKKRKKRPRWLSVILSLALTLNFLIFPAFADEAETDAGTGDATDTGDTTDPDGPTGAGDASDSDDTSGAGDTSGANDATGAIDALAVARGNTYYQQYSIYTTKADAVVTCSFAVNPDEILFGDWDGDGVDTLCVRRSGNMYYFQQNPGNAQAYVSVAYGKSTDMVYAGTWN